MCGICGSVALASGPPGAEGVRAMLAELTHRGPDSEGLLETPRVAAGIRRLRVIDLRTGDQPIESEDGSVQVVFNGEIYNYRELRSELEGAGHRFGTRSDTEVLVHLWEDDGPGMLGRLDGMFAFCLHDRKTDEVFLARDRLGVKPLFYRESGGRLDFASEIRALLRAPGAPPDLDEQALVELFCLQYVPGERTPYRGVRKLLPGRYLHVREGRLEGRIWWEVPGGGEDSGLDEERVRGELPALLAAAVRKQTVSDVPLGMFLSGGIDSTVLLHLLSDGAARPVSTFSVGFEGESGDADASHARLVAARYGTRHHELRVRAGEAADWLPRLVDHLAMPVTDPALIPTALLSEFARREVTVALTGEGADEIFGGYRRYLLQARLSWLGRIPGLRHAARLRPLAALLPSRAGQALDALAEREPARNHFLWSATVDLGTARAVFEDAAVAAAERSAVEAFRGRLGAGAGTSARLATDLSEWLPHDLLAKVDLASMAHSLEARVPYLDPAVVSWAARLPQRLRFARGATKVALREAFAGSIPAEVLRRPKRGFDLPLAAWIRGPLRSMAGDLLTGRAEDRLPSLRRGRAAAMLDLHLRGERDLGFPLFLLMSILLFLDRRGRA
jgi:asparagine synthase (glutamine-hydrolysing)